MQGSVDDGPVSGAPAEVSGERILDALHIRRSAFEVHREKRHDEAGRAESALGSVQVHHRVLYLMKRPVGSFQMLHCQDVTAVERQQRPYAGIDRLMANHPVAQSPHDNCARAAVAFRATLLGADPALIESQPVQQGRVRRNFTDLVKFGPEIESDTGAHSDCLLKDSLSKTGPYKDPSIAPVAVRSCA